MDLHEQLALQMAKERIKDAVRAAEQMRDIRLAGARHPARARLGKVLVRLGRWMMGEAVSGVDSPWISSDPTPGRR